MKKMCLIIVALLLLGGCGTSKTTLSSAGSTGNSMTEPIVWTYDYQVRSEAAIEESMSRKNADSEETSSGDNYHAYLYGSADWNEDRLVTDGTESPEREISFDGQTIKALFVKTRCVDFEPDAVEVYKYQTYDESKEFEFNHRTGKLVGFKVMYRDVSQSQNELPLVIPDEETAVLKAKEAVLKYFDVDLDNYTVDTVMYYGENKDLDKNFGNYFVYFTRLLQGMATCDKLVVSISDRGTVFEITAHNQHLFDDMSSEEAAELAEIDVAAKIEEYAAEYNRSQDMLKIRSISIDSGAVPPFITYTPDHQKVIIVQVHLVMERIGQFLEDGTPWIYEDAINLVIK